MRGVSIQHSVEIVTFKSAVKVPNAQSGETTEPGTRSHLDPGWVAQGMVRAQMAGSVPQPVICLTTYKML